MKYSRVDEDDIVFTQTNTEDNMIIINHANREKSHKVSTIDEIEYNLVLSESKTFLIRMFVLSITEVFMRSSRHPIWISFADQFNSPTHPSIFLISIILSIGMLWKGISGLIYVSLSKKIGYNKVLLMLLLLITSTIFMECMTHNFLILSIAFCLSQTSIYDVVIAAIAWFLPLKHAMKYTLLLNAASIFSYISGPAIAGIVTYYKNYRWVFWINFMLGCVIFIYGIFFVIINSQKKLESKQAKIQYDEVVSENHDLQYPIYRKTQQNLRFKSKKKTRQKLLFEYFMVFLSIFIKSIVSSSSSILGFYYIFYIQHYIYPGKTGVIYGAVQLLLASLGGIIGSMSTMILCKKRVFFKYMVLLINSAIYGLIMYFIFPHWHHGERNLFYLYMFVCGVLAGSVCIVTQMIAVEFQPSSNIGYISGFSGMLTASCKAFVLLFVGYYWNKYKNIMFYTLVYIMMVAFVLSLLMGIVYCCYNRYSKKNKHRVGSRTIGSTKSAYSTLHSVNSTYTK